MTPLLRARAALRLGRYTRLTSGARALSTSPRWAGHKQPAHSTLDPMTGELTALPDIDV